MNKLQLAANDVALLLIRAMLGVVFVYHGSQKLFGAFGGGGLSGMAGFLEQLQEPVPYVSALTGRGGGVLRRVGSAARCLGPDRGHPDGLHHARRRVHRALGCV